MWWNMILEEILSTINFETDYVTVNLYNKKHDKIVDVKSSKFGDEDSIEDYEEWKKLKVFNVTAYDENHLLISIEQCLCHNCFYSGCYNLAPCIDCDDDFNKFVLKDSE